MKNSVILLVILIVVSSCRNNESDIIESDDDKVGLYNHMSSKDSLLTELREIRQCEFNYDSLHVAFELNQPYENYLSRDKFSWLYSELSDTARFA